MTKFFIERNGFSGYQEILGGVALYGTLKPQEKPKNKRKKGDEGL